MASHLPALRCRFRVKRERHFQLESSNAARADLAHHGHQAVRVDRTKTIWDDGHARESHLGAVDGSEQMMMALGRVSRETIIGIAVTSLALAAMAVDHLIGDDPGLEDPPAFLIAAAVLLGAAILVFGRYIPSMKKASSERVARSALIFGLVAVPSIATSALGLPFVVAGGAIALGMLARSGGEGRRATAAIALGTAVLLFVTGYYVEQASNKLFG